jgi:hypothetical protein
MEGGIVVLCQQVLLVNVQHDFPQNRTKGGDLNHVMSREDCNPCKALVKTLDLVDV